MFGTFHIYQNISVANIPELTKLGPDALSKEFDSQYLFSITSKTSKSIKTLLMDQQNVAGIGNIYADEILFAAKLNPLKISKQLTLKQCATIVIVTKKILQTAIKAGGTTFATFASANSKIGSYQTKLKVYGREGKPCVVCGTILKKIKVNGRGTVYCPKCQKL
jgi:formamidopyrimidine-DNA glycosylase